MAQTQLNYTKLLADNKITGLANPERFTTNNKFDAAKAKGAYITEVLGLDNSVLKNDVAKAGFAKQIRDLGLDYTKFKFDANGVKQANTAKSFKDMGLANPERFIGKDAEAEAAVIREVYKLDPAAYAGSTKVKTGTRIDPNSGKTVDVFTTYAKYNLEAASKEYQFQQPKIEFREAANFGEALGLFSAAITTAQNVGVQNINPTDLRNIRRLAEEIYDTARNNSDPSVKAVVDSVNTAMTRLDEIADLQTSVSSINARKGPKNNWVAADGTKTTGDTKKRLEDKLFTDQNSLEVAITRANREITPLLGVIGRVNPLASTGLSAADLAVISGTTAGGAAGGTTATSPGNTYATSGGNVTSDALSKLAAGVTNPAPRTTVDSLISSGTLNSQIGDADLQRIIDETSTYKINSGIDTQNAVISNINSQIQSVDSVLSKIDSTNPYYSQLVARKEALNKDLGNATTILTNYTDIRDGKKPNLYAVSIADVRKDLQLPEQKAMTALNEIDPSILRDARLLQDQYSSMISSPLGPTQDDRTEALRGLIEDEAMNQLRLGSTLDESVRREVQQASRGAQAARGNIFGVAPAVEEAMQTGMMGEQRKAQRYGAAAAFLGSGMTRGDQAARDTALRQSLDLTRLGAANAFMAEGANPYNLSRQRVADQDARTLNYINANAAATGGFANTAQQAEAYRYVNPNAGINLAQNATSIYGGLLDFTSRNYGSQVDALSRVAQANSIPNYISAFSGLVPSFSF